MRPTPSSPADHAAGTHRHHDDDQHHAQQGQGDILDWDAQVLAEVNADIVDWLPLGQAPRHILDLGCGTGAGTFALLERFPDARVTAIDASIEHVQRLRVKASSAGVDAQVSVVHADLDELDWPGLGSPDLVWASASLHHLADPGSVLQRVHDVLQPGGVFAVVELAGFPRFLPEDAPEEAPGVEGRCHAVIERDLAAHLPHRGADWGSQLTSAGFTVEAHRTIPVHVPAAGNPGVGAYALAGLRRIFPRVADQLSPADRAALDGLLDAAGPRSILRRADLAVRTEREVWAARRPTS